MNSDTCGDCGAAVANGKSGCLGLFEDILAERLAITRYGKIHRLTVDTYALQHPDRYMRSGKSFAAHLTGMCAALEYENTFAPNQVVQRWLSTNPQINKPTRIPEHRGNLTITYIHSDSDTDEHVKRVREWAQAVWPAWSEHHDLARQLISEAKLKSNRLE